jgi:hypothetical protein
MSKSDIPLIAALDAPAADNHGLRALLERTPIWKGCQPQPGSGRKFLARLVLAAARPAAGVGRIILSTMCINPMLRQLIILHRLETHLSAIADCAMQQITGPA